MKRLIQALSIISLFALFTACAPDSRQEPSQATTTYEPPRPVILNEEGYQIARGATRVQDMAVKWDAETKSMSLRGKIEYLPMKGNSVQSLEIDLSGLYETGGFVTLKNQRRDLPQKEEVRIAAKATCLSAEGRCASSFIDIYIYTEGVVYHHQLESHNESPVDEKKEETPSEIEEELETEGGADEVEGEPGHYIGTVIEDIEKILEVKPQPKAEEPKKETPKTETPKKETPKEDVKKEQPKKEDPAEKETPSAPTKPAIKSANQAVGSVNAGRLENAVDLLKYEENHKPAGFHIIRPKRKTHFATNELAYLIVQISQFVKKEIPGYVLSVGDLSRESGGRLGSHKSHQNGLDADIAFLFNNKSFQGYFASAVAVDKTHGSWMVAEQYELFKQAVQTQLVDRIFIHKTLKKALCAHAIKAGELQKGQNTGLAHETLRRLIADTDHHNHFHLRVKCSKAQVRCRQMAEPAPGSGCF
ncbi:penicillin-insensitive murein endopeptidase [Bdellovibrio bacteriovorus]|uniref:penicillin-insensitive murein endopeptidase n=1 Tax=Bdellovibrio bacteriovorus TaxID=959 RepID=UPI0035A597EB